MPVAKRPTTQAGPNPRPRNMRSFIPLTKHTNINNFPKIEYKRYPLMPVDENGQPFLDEYQQVIKLHDEDEEEQFKKDNPTMASVPDSPQTQADELTKLREENARLKAEREADNAAKTDPQAGANSGVAGLVQPAGAEPPKQAAGGSASGNKPGNKPKPVEPKLPD